MLLLLFTGVDRAGMCRMLSHRVHIDTTPPVAGQVRCGPYYNMVSRSASLVFVNDLYTRNRWTRSLMNCTAMSLVCSAVIGQNSVAQYNIVGVGVGVVLFL